MKNITYNINNLNINLQGLTRTEFEYFLITLKSLKNIYGDAIKYSDADIYQTVDYGIEGKGTADLSDLINLI